MERAGELPDRADGKQALTLFVLEIKHCGDGTDNRRIPEAVYRTVSRVLDDLSCIAPSDALEALVSPCYCPPEKRDATLREKVEKSIVRFRKEPDLWAALASALLKSLAYYRSLDPRIGIKLSAASDDAGLSPGMEDLAVGEKEKKILPIVDLPRTRRNRPYVPRLSGGGARCCEKREGEENTKHGVEVVDEDCGSTMSVSHQHPWVCMVQHGNVRRQQQKKEGAASSESGCLSLGMDVVVFEAKVRKYAPTLADFMANFEQCFTPWEWKRIAKFTCASSWVFGLTLRDTRERSDDSKLREFYLRWSIKEAYTKALGVGMYTNLEDFETSLLGIDKPRADGSEGVTTVAEEEDEGIWAAILRRARDGGDSGSAVSLGQLSVVGEVKRLKPKLTVERWEFIFVPLGKDSSSCNSCACICRGPLSKEAVEGHEAGGSRAAIETLTLEDLVRLHGSEIIL